MGQGSITDPGEDRWIPLLPHGSLGADADKIAVKFNVEKGYTFQFTKSKKYITFDGPPSINNKLLDGDKPRYFKIEQHPYQLDCYAIKVAEDKNFHLGLAMERIFPPWIAMSNFPEKQPWKFEKA
ncbi:hypothetical protein RhiLY_09445 [Ceratobasidium sp. AG-Ba]|nr:hypothetical protein RhiLY_09445 [Ceratobasidium sp. AG-Ba]